MPRSIGKSAWSCSERRRKKATGMRNMPSAIGISDDVEQDYKKAIVLYRKAANKGNAEAQYALGCCYEYGDGIKKNVDLAVKWYTKAADQGYTEAQKALAELV